MRILLAQNMFHLPTHGGANKSNRILMEQLAARGHECHVVAPMSGALRQTSLDRHLSYLEGLGAAIRSVSAESVTYEHEGVVAHAVVSPSRLAREVGAVAAALDPSWTLVPSDDPGMIMLGAASRATPGRVVYLAHTLQQLPFGPGAFYPSAAGTRLVKAAAGVVAVSRAARDHLREWGPIESELIYPQVYGDPVTVTGPGPGSGSGSGSGDEGAVTMVNPCAYKGLPIFLALADARPDTSFLAVPTWGATGADLDALHSRPNIRLVEPADDIGVILAMTKVLVMPSLWDETFGYTAVEAMLRGIPVLASDVGGLSEAKLGVPYLLPVRPITGYEAGAHARPVPVVPEQDARPWAEALDRLLSDPGHRRELGRLSREAATSFVASLDEGALERYLGELTPAPATPAADRPRARALTPERRAALAARLAVHAAPPPPGTVPDQGDHSS
ncbi:glycosyltransferase family 4 protein [Sphaerisporangium sp. NPDC049002]|uniref:glycosyltransferase family 4 protein n=1 Tax=Sphaerisporangium sp. NPDC049002 TaxID=3155392 RepID=UPI0033F0C561